ncbi:hypothetical protein [Sphingobacterium kyonggiense]
MAQKKEIDWKDAFDVVDDFSHIIVDNGTQKGKKITKDLVKAILATEGSELTSLQGGTTSSPTILNAPPTNEFRWAEASPGEYKFGSEPNMVATTGKRWRIEWIGGVPSLKDMGELPKGTDGKTILTGLTSPNNSDGVIGDLFFDKKAMVIYGPKQESGWGIGSSMTPDKVLYRSGTNIFNGYGGEFGKVLNNAGVIVNSVDWYTSPPIPWGDQTQAVILSRAWAQFDINDNVVSNWFNSSSTVIEQSLTKSENAVYFRTSVGMTSRETARGNFGATLLPFEKYYNKPYTVYNTPVYANMEPKEYLKEMFFSEAFQPQSATYTDGVINSPFNVVWMDGNSGVITLTRNTNGSVTAVTATHIKDGITRTLSVTITRDSEENAINVNSSVNQ